jgi:hypothetical protein
MNNVRTALRKKDIVRVLHETRQTADGSLSGCKGPM